MLPEDWHADHIAPWHLTQRTNVHEMQALCPACNLKKGGAILMPTPGAAYRSFQAEAFTLTGLILGGRFPHKDIFFDVTTGGGKGSLPLIFSRLVPHFADQIAWIVPRASLATQGELVFIDEEKEAFRHLIGITHEIRKSTNDYNPARGTAGFVTTYQALAADTAGITHAALLSKRTILILDEPHHIKDNLKNPDDPELKWKRAVQPLIDAAVLRIYMSGTFARGDDAPIAFLPYVAEGRGYALNFPPEQTVRYSRFQALKEQAIVPLHFHILDGQAEWLDRQGQRIKRDSFDSVKSQEGSAMLMAALQTQYAEHLLEKTVEAWQGYRTAYGHGKLLVVAPFIAVAKSYVRFLRQLGVHALIATTDKEDEAEKNIGLFSDRAGSHACTALVTVAMAYEGLDVPSVTHMACLTHYRSEPWLEQCFGRTCRRFREKPCGHIFIPDDPDFRRIAERLLSEQRGLAYSPTLLPEEPTGGNPGGDLPPQEPPEPIVPLASTATDMRSWDLASGQGMTREETDRILALAKEEGIIGCDALQLKRVFAKWENRVGKMKPPKPPLTKQTVSEREIKLRQQIEKRCAQMDSAAQVPFGTTNKRLIRHYHKKREDMLESELLAVWAYLDEEASAGDAYA